jgi:hypothetical protein
MTYFSVLRYTRTIPARGDGRLSRSLLDNVTLKHLRLLRPYEIANGVNLDLKGRYPEFNPWALVQHGFLEKDDP